MEDADGSVLEALLDDRPNALITDLRMPRADGASLLRSMGRNHPDIPVVVMTAASRVAFRSPTLPI